MLCQRARLSEEVALLLYSILINFVKLILCLRNMANVVDIFKGLKTKQSIAYIKILNNVINILYRFIIWQILKWRGQSNSKLCLVKIPQTISWFYSWTHNLLPLHEMLQSKCTCSKVLFIAGRFGATFM